MIRRSLDEQAAIWLRVCYRAVADYRHLVRFTLTNADCDDIVGEVIVRVMSKIQNGDWTFASRKLLRGRVLDMLEAEGKRRRRHQIHIERLRENANDRNAWKTYAYWNGMGSGNADSAGNRLRTVALVLPPLEGAVFSIAVSSGLDLSSKQTHSRIGKALGLATETVRKYARQARMKLSDIEGADEDDWREFDQFAEKESLDILTIGYRAILRERIAALADRDLCGDEDLLLLFRASIYRGDVFRHLALLSVKATDQGVLLDLDRISEMVALVKAAPFANQQMQAEFGKYVQDALQGRVEAWLSLVEDMRKPPVRESVEFYQALAADRDRAIAAGEQWSPKLNQIRKQIE